MYYHPLLSATNRLPILELFLPPSPSVIPIAITPNYHLYLPRLLPAYSPKSHTHMDIAKPIPDTSNTRHTGMATIELSFSLQDLRHQRVPIHAVRKLYRLLKEQDRLGLTSLNTTMSNLPEAILARSIPHSARVDWLTLAPLSWATEAQLTQRRSVTIYLSMAQYLLQTGN